MTVYLITATALTSDHTYPVKVFLNEEKAKAFAKTRNEGFYGTQAVYLVSAMVVADGGEEA